ncbi:hypothetical protein B0H19DRAFT_1085679 [Mycena capillaripes]|nr:hypothetical protein B0H19DRAFT_1085679 [Mycena capillaripes]
MSRVEVAADRKEMKSSSTGVSLKNKIRTRESYANYRRRGLLKDLLGALGYYAYQSRVRIEGATLNASIRPENFALRASVCRNDPGDEERTAPKQIKGGDELFETSNIQSVQEARELAATLQNESSSVAVSIQIPADKSLLDAYTQQIWPHYGNTELKEESHLAELAERRKQWETDMVDAAQGVLTSNFEHLEYVLPAWHVPVFIPLAKCTKLTSLALQWRMDEPLNKLAECTDDAVFAAFSVSLYEALSTIPSVQRLRLSLPRSPFHFAEWVIKRLLTDSRILPNLRTLDLTHCSVDCATVLSILRAHPGIQHLILDQGPTWSEPEDDETCIEDEDEDASEPEIRGPPTVATIVEQLGYGWASLGAYIALNPHLSLCAISAANVDVPMQMYTAPLTADALHAKLCAGAAGAAGCADAPQDVRESAVQRVEKLALCDTWPVAYLDEEVYGPEKRRAHATGCAHMEGYTPAFKPKTDVWPDKSPEELSYINVF